MVGTGTRRTLITKACPSAPDHRLISNRPPAIAGQNDKAGEASLRIAKQINTLSTPYNRPVSDLKATYLIFPGTADKPFGPPDLDKLQARCEALVKEIGGASVPLHHWENIIPPPPTPTPTPSPYPSVTPSPTSPPGASASPSATFAFPSPSPSGAASASPTPGKSASPRRVRRDPNAQKSDSR